MSSRADGVAIGASRKIGVTRRALAMLSSWLTRRSSFAAGFDILQDRFGDIVAGDEFRQSLGRTDAVLFADRVNAVADPNLR